MKISHQEAGRLGALKRNSIYGNPATEEGRRKGGLISYQNFKLRSELINKNKFKIEKEIVFPEKNPLLAEFAGIV